MMYKITKQSWPDRTNHHLRIREAKNQPNSGQTRMLRHERGYWRVVKAKCERINREFPQPLDGNFLIMRQNGVNSQ